MTTSALPSPCPARAARPGRLGLAVLLSGGFITIFDLFVVNIAIPSMQRTLDASFAQINFIIVAYELAYGVLLIAGSRLGDRLGRRRLFVLGMLGFALTSALCGLAPDANALICARALQGVAAAMLFPQVYALIRVSYDGHARRRAFGLLGMTLGLAAIAGQVLGGWIVHADLFGLSWRVIFLVNVPLGLAAWKLARHLPESREPSASSMDWPGAALAGLGLGLLMLALIEGPARHWPAWTLASAMLAVAALALFVRAQRRIGAAGGAPLVDMTLLTQPRFATGCLLVLLVFSTAAALFLCYALLMQTGLGVDALTAGSIFAPASVGFVAGSMLAGLGGALWGLYQQSVVPQLGAQVNVLIFIVIMIGGLGSTVGCLIGALLVGLMANYTGFLMPKAALFSNIALMVAILLWRPQGVYPVANR